jgi:uncharacterized membrane protein YukC
MKIKRAKIQKGNGFGIILLVVLFVGFLSLIYAMPSKLSFTILQIKSDEKEFKN